MRKDLYLYVRHDPMLHQYIRMHPHWYRKLGRNPESIVQLKQEAKQYFGKTLPQRVEKLHQNLQLAMMVMQMFQSNFNSFHYEES